jgi:hypothetical protein
VGDVVAAVPGVEGDGLGEGLAAVFGMHVAALPLIFGEGAEEQDPAGVEAVEDVERKVDGGGAGVGEFSPAFLLVSADGGPVLGEGEAHADVRIHMAVSKMMDKLADGPAAVAIGCIELSFAEAGDGGAEILRERGENGDGGGVIGKVGLGAAETADGVARVCFSRGGGGGCGAHSGKVHRRNRRDKSGGVGRIRSRSLGAGLVVGCAVVGLVVLVVVVVMRGGKGRRGEQHQEGEETELLHGGYRMAQGGIDGI